MRNLPTASAAKALLMTPEPYNTTAKNFGETDGTFYDDAAEVSDDDGEGEEKDVVRMARTDGPSRPVGIPLTHPAGVHTMPIQSEEVAPCANLSAPSAYLPIPALSQTAPPTLKMALATATKVCLKIPRAEIRTHRKTLYVRCSLHVGGRRVAASVLKPVEKVSEEHELRDAFTAP